MAIVHLSRPLSVSDAVFFSISGDDGQRKEREKLLVHYVVTLISGEKVSLSLLK